MASKNLIVLSSCFVSGGIEERCHGPQLIGYVDPGIHLEGALARLGILLKKRVQPFEGKVDTGELAFSPIMDALHQGRENPIKIGRFNGVRPIVGFEKPGFLSGIELPQSESSSEIVKNGTLPLPFIVDTEDSLRIDPHKVTPTEVPVNQSPTTLLWSKLSKAWFQRLKTGQR